MKVAVVGAGIGGLVSALRLSERCDVTVFESSAFVGGKIGFVEHLGVRCDTGPSVVTMIDTIEALELGLEFRAPEPAFVYRWPDGTELQFGHGRTATLDGVEAAFGTKDRTQFDSFLRYATQIWDAAAPAFVYADAPRFSTIASAPLTQIGRVRKIDAMRSMKSAIIEKISNPYLRDVLIRYATYNGSDPRVAPATLNCIAHVELVDGGYGLQGGYYALVEALRKKATAQGVDFRTETNVDSIDIEHNRVVGLTTTENAFQFDAIVSNADITHLQRDLLEQKDPKVDLSMSGWNAIIATENDAFPNAHTVFFPTSYESEFEDIFDRNRLPETPTIYACNQAVTHGVEFPDGTQPVFLMINAPAGESTVGKEQGLERVRKQLAKHNVSIPDPFWIRTPQELAGRFPGSGGSIYGPSSNSRFAAFKRAPNAHRTIKGLYIASGSAHPGGGVPMCVLSGEHASRALLDNIT